MYDLIVENAKIVSPDSTVVGDVAVRGGRVEAILEAFSGVVGTKKIKADGKLLIPGLIDPHTHIEHAHGPRVNTVDNFFSSTASGALGGVTTVIDFAIQKKGTLPLEIIEKRLAQAEKSATDYSFHCCLTESNRNVLEQIGEVVRSGVPSFKVFMAYRSRGWQCDDGTLLAILTKSKEIGAIVGVHAENGDIIDYNVSEAVRSGQTQAIHHALTRPPFTEEEAIRRACYLARVAGSALYDFHMSIAGGVEVIREERTLGSPIYAETCTQYLSFTKDVLKKSDGINYICSPPFRDEADIEALWEGLAQGVVSVTASDHCVLSSKQKRQGSASFSKVPGGIWGMEYRLPYLFSEGVNRRGMSVNRLVAVTSTNAARIFGMYPRKGIIAPGSDADFVLVDAEKEAILSSHSSLLDVDWCPYEGIPVKGVPVLTVLRGKIVAENGKFCGEMGYGQYIKRTIDPTVLERPIL